MPKLTSYVCDECSTVKKETNYWWALRTGVDPVTGHEQLVIAPLVLNKVGIPYGPISLIQERKLACGRECVGKIVSQWMDKTSRPSPTGSDIVSLDEVERMGTEGLPTSEE